MGSVDNTTFTDPGLDIAIVGGGIAGLVLALGLIKRNVNVRIFDQAQSFREIGAGIGFTPNAEWAMKIVDKRIHAGFKKVATRNASDWFQYVDGYHEDGDDARKTKQKSFFDMYLGERGFEGCSRPDFLNELSALLPEGVVHFQKRLKSITDEVGGEKVVLNFEDGTIVDADAVIGCDGIRSKVRQLLLGPENPASYPHYSHKYAARGLIPMAKAVEVLGDYKPSTRFMHLGPNAHALTFPVAGGSLMNVVAFITDPKEWPHQAMTAKIDKAEVTAAFANHGTTVRAIIGLLPEQLDQWAVFDTYDHQVPTYFSGRIAIAGDAAHASAPHHGAGAGFCIEDAAVLSSLLETVGLDKKSDMPGRKAELLRVAFETYNSVRLERCQWLVNSSRIIGELYQWQHPEAGSDREKCRDETETRSHLIWDYNVDKLVLEADEKFSRNLAELKIC